MAEATPSRVMATRSAKRRSVRIEIRIHPGFFKIGIALARYQAGACHEKVGFDPVSRVAPPHERAIDHRVAAHRRKTTRCRRAKKSAANASTTTTGPTKAASKRCCQGVPGGGRRKLCPVAADGHTSEDNAAPGSTFEPRDSIWAGPL